ncbi:MAG: hypothetical protein KF773_08730 [Deltaproteobacteria bacterium]|nr:hypothetical protein [Deltaproteobacteria bacterium]
MRYPLLVPLALVGCSGSEEAATVDLPVTTSPAALAPAATDLGYQVSLTRVRIAVAKIEFTIEGEMHGDAAARVVGTAPHPGHSAGGEVTGELPGEFILEWNGRAQPQLGLGRLIVGDYQGANFAIRAASARDGLAANDPLVGHAFHLTGTITKDATTRPFDALLDVEPDTSVIGAVFHDVITEASTETLALEFYPTDPVEGDTPFDGVDYFTLPTTADGAIAIRPGQPEHNIIRRAIQTHDQYGVQTL